MSLSCMSILTSLRAGSFVLEGDIVVQFTKLSIPVQFIYTQPNGIEHINSAKQSNEVWGWAPAQDFNT
jgi:hypothetical protein